MSVRLGSMFTGYGGLELGLALAGVDARTVWHAETDADVAGLLTSAGPNHGDVDEVEWTGVTPVSILTAGMPCQPVSIAGPKRGREDDRWMWPQTRRAIVKIRPQRIFLENVPHLTRIRSGGLFGGMLTDLTQLGYRVRWTTVGACHAGAAHHRHRVFVLAVRGRGRRADEIPYVACGRTDLLPTPTARDGSRGPGRADYWKNRREVLGRTNGLPLDSLIPTLHCGRTGLLPTPRASDGVNGGPGQRGSSGDLAMSSAVQPKHWARFRDAVAQHEARYGRAPRPTEPNSNGSPRLSPAFAEWLMCLPAGHVTAKLPRVKALRAIGNGVCPPQAALAWSVLSGEKN